MKMKKMSNFDVYATIVSLTPFTPVSIRFLNPIKKYLPQKSILWSIPPLAWEIEYTFAQCTDTPNFIFAIKQGGLGKTLKVYNSLLAQLA